MSNVTKPIVTTTQPETTDCCDSDGVGGILTMPATAGCVLCLTLLVIAQELLIQCF